MRLPWPALERVDGRLGLRLVTAYGVHQAWAVPAPRRTRSDRTPSTTEAATLVQRRWDQLRAAGYLEDPRLERPRPHTELHTVTLAATVLLVAVSLLVLGAG